MWEDTFDTEELAFEVFARTLETEGMSAFANKAATQTVYEGLAGRSSRVRAFFPLEELPWQLAVVVAASPPSRTVESQPS